MGEAGIHPFIRCESLSSPVNSVQPETSEFFLYEGLVPKAVPYPLYEIWCTVRLCGPSLLQGTQSVGTYLTVLRENLVRHISFDLNYGKCLCFGLKLYT